MAKINRSRHYTRESLKKLYIKHDGNITNMSEELGLHRASVRKATKKFFNKSGSGIHKNAPTTKELNKIIKYIKANQSKMTYAQLAENLGMGFNKFRRLIEKHKLTKRDILISKGILTK